MQHPTIFALMPCQSQLLAAEYTAAQSTYAIALNELVGKPLGATIRCERPRRNRKAKALVKAYYNGSLRKAFRN